MNQKKKKNVAVVGAGVGGLATVARLASRGYQVDVYEKLPECGGRAHMIEDQGFKFDTGPSFVLMPDFFREVFTYCYENIEDYLTLKKLDCHYKIFYPDRETLSVYSDTERTKQEIEQIEPGGSQAFEGFLKESKRYYRVVEPLLYRYLKPSDIVSPDILSLIIKLKVWQSYWQLAKKYFKNERICYALTFEAMFIGVSPFKTPSFYSIITYADHIQKIFHPMGGMYEIPLALEKLGKKFGARYHYGKEIKKITTHNGSVKLHPQEGNDIPTDRVVINADYSYSQETLLKRKLPNFTYSCSVFLLYLGLKTKVQGIEHHNLFFSSDLRKNLEQIFDTKISPEDPSFYVHVPTVTDPGLAPEGKDLFYILIPVANLQNQKEIFDKYRDQLRSLIFFKIREQTGINLEDLIEVEHHFIPQDFIGRYNIQYGATFGLAHSFAQSAFFRPGNQDRRYSNIYYAGASSQPGGGIPPVIASSRIVADLISKEDRPILVSEGT